METEIVDNFIYFKCGKYEYRYHVLFKFMDTTGISGGDWNRWGHSLTEEERNAMRGSESFKHAMRKFKLRNYEGR